MHISTAAETANPIAAAVGMCVTGCGSVYASVHKNLTLANCGADALQKQQQADH